MDPISIAERGCERPANSLSTRNGNNLGRAIIARGPVKARPTWPRLAGVRDMKSGLIIGL